MSKKYIIIEGINQVTVTSQTLIQTEPGGNIGIVLFNASSDDFRDICQTFISPKDCLLSSIKINVGIFPSIGPGSIIMTVRPTDINGKPTSTILGTSTKNFSDLTNIEQIILPFSFNHIELNEGIKYAFVIHVIFSEPSDSIIVIAGTNVEENVYPTGSLLYNTSTNTWELIDTARDASELSEYGWTPVGGIRQTWFEIQDFVAKNDAKLYITFNSSENKLNFLVKQPNYNKSGTIDLS